MILPYITAITFDVCQAVPRSQREGSLALGATRWQTIWTVVLPYARPGIVAACFLALGRALGETMAVTMLIGNQAVIDLLAVRLGDSIASLIANQLNEADDPTVPVRPGRAGAGAAAGDRVFNISARLLLARLTRAGGQPGRGRRRRGPGDRRRGRSRASAPPPVRHRRRLPGPLRAGFWNRVMTGVLAGVLLLTVVPLFLILGYITVRGAAAAGCDLVHGGPAGRSTKSGRPRSRSGRATTSAGGPGGLGTRWSAA